MNPRSCRSTADARLCRIEWFSATSTFSSTLSPSKEADILKCPRDSQTVDSERLFCQRIDWPPMSNVPSSGA